MIINLDLEMNNAVSPARSPGFNKEPKAAYALRSQISVSWSTFYRTQLAELSARGCVFQVPCEHMANKK